MAKACVAVSSSIFCVAFQMSRALWRRRRGVRRLHHNSAGASKYAVGTRFATRQCATFSISAGVGPPSRICPNGMSRRCGLSLRPHLAFLGSPSQISSMDNNICARVRCAALLGRFTWLLKVPFLTQFPFFSPRAPFLLLL